VKVWIDAQLSPALAGWLTAAFGLEATAVRDLRLRNATDDDIFFAARAVVVLTKDGDFVRLLEQHGPTPQVVWLTCGNTSNAQLRELLSARFREALELLERGEPIVEIGAAS